MPTPANADEFLTVVRKSGMVDEQRLDGYLQPLMAGDNLPNDPRKLSGLLIRDGLITYFQAEQFLRGKYLGFTIGKYKLLERVGSGGMGQVFLCEHLYMKRRVAIKVLPPSKAEDPALLGRFYREARAAGTLDHPNIVHTHDIDRDGPRHFLIMEYVDGASLVDIVRKFGPMSIDRAAHYVRQAAEALEYAHHTGVIHRDIKPGNLMVDREGVVKVLDMGLARFLNDQSDMLTLKYDEQNVLGTADYVAPEQVADSHNVDIRADIYSLGATFYFLLAGRPPFPEGTVQQKLLAHQKSKPQPIRDLRPEVPPALAAVLERMMARNLRSRFQRPAEVALALAPWAAEPIPPPPEAEMPRLSPVVEALLRAGTATGGSSSLLARSPARGGAGSSAYVSLPEINLGSSRRDRAAAPPPPPRAVNPRLFGGVEGSTLGSADTGALGGAAEETPVPYGWALGQPGFAAPETPRPRRSPMRGMAALLIAVLLGTALGFGAWWKLAAGSGGAPTEPAPPTGRP
jgi:serine/threonine protein kinase